METRQHVWEYNNRESGVLYYCEIDGMRYEVVSKKNDDRVSKINCA